MDCSIRLRNSSKTSSTCSTLPSGDRLLVGHRQILCHSRSIRATRTFYERQNLTSPRRPSTIAADAPTSAGKSIRRPWPGATSRSITSWRHRARCPTRRGGRPLRVRPLGLGPVRPDRRGRPQPRSRPAVTRRRLPARGDRAAAVRERAVYETYNKGLSLVPTAELPWYRHTWDQAHEEHRGGAFDEHAPLVEELGSDPIRRPDERDRRRASGHDRLVLAADEPGPRDPRSARGGRGPRDRATGRQPARLRPRAPLSAGCWRNARPRTNSNGTDCSAATGRTASWEPAARPSCGSGPPAARRNARCDAPS